MASSRKSDRKNHMCKDYYTKITLIQKTKPETCKKPGSNGPEAFINRFSPTEPSESV